MKPLRVFFRILLWSIISIVGVHFINSLAWGLIFFGPKHSAFAGFIMKVLGLPYEIFYFPVLRMPKGNIFDSSEGMLYVTIIIGLCWGTLFAFLQLKFSEYRSRRNLNPVTGK
jgi:hypothetical protein